MKQKEKKKKMIWLLLWGVFWTYLGNCAPSFPDSAQHSVVDHRWGHTAVLDSLILVGDVLLLLGWLLSKLSCFYDEL